MLAMQITLHYIPVNMYVIYVYVIENLCISVRSTLYEATHNDID
jgi:hypothetical protein